MANPRLDHEAMMSLRVTLRPLQIGRTPAGHRVEVPFEGVQGIARLYVQTWDESGFEL